jgi:beta-glucosidase
MLHTKIIVLWIWMVGLGLSNPVTIFPQTQSEVPIYQDARQPLEVRAEDLLRRMTLKEKVGQLNRPAIFREQDLRGKAPGTLEDLKKFAAGTYTDEIGPGNGFLGFPDPILPARAHEQAELYNALQAAALKGTRLKIPLLEEATGTHGVPLTGCTIFPEGLAIGSSWDMDLVKTIYAAVAREARALGIHELDTLVIEPNRDPRLGRNSEGYSEDPYICSRIAESIVHGIQGDNVAAKDKAVAMLCHYPGQSQPVSGLERGAMEISERNLRESFLPPWVAGIKKAGALGVMATYPEIDDTPAHGSEKLLTRILREELGFRGLVISEGYGFKTLLDEGIVSTQKEAGALALRAGVDISLTYEPAYLKPLIENVEEGRVSMELVDRAVRRVLLQKLRLGLFENPYVDPVRASQVVHSQEHQDLALRASRDGIVLLKNEKHLLPLAKDVKSIAVIGPDADEPRNQLGDYISPNIPQHIVTVLEGIKAKAAPGSKVVYARGCNVMGDDKSGFV